MVKDKYYCDENDFEDFEDFEEFYGLEQKVEEEPSELDFSNTENKLVGDCSLDREGTEEIDG